MTVATEEGFEVGEERGEGRHDVSEEEDDGEGGMETVRLYEPCLM